MIFKARTVCRPDLFYAALYAAAFLDKCILLFDLLMLSYSVSIYFSAICLSKSIKGGAKYFASVHLQCNISADVSQNWDGPHCKKHFKSCSSAGFSQKWSYGVSASGGLFASIFENIDY